VARQTHQPTPDPTASGAQPCRWNRANITTVFSWTASGATTLNARCASRTHSEAPTPCAWLRRLRAVALACSQKRLLTSSQPSAAGRGNLSSARWESRWRFPALETGFLLQGEGGS
jgi:hypothetical protein